MRRMMVVVLVLIVTVALAVPSTAQARGYHSGGPGLVVPCLFGLGVLALWEFATHHPSSSIVVAPTQCFELVPVWGKEYWDGSAYVRPMIGKRPVPAPCPPVQ